MFARFSIKSLLFMEAGVSTYVVDQEVSRRSINALEAQIRSHAHQYGICGEQSNTTTDFPLCTYFPHHFHKIRCSTIMFYLSDHGRLADSETACSVSNPFPVRGFFLAFKRSHQCVIVSAR